MRFLLLTSMSLIFSLFALNSCSSPGSSGIKIDAPIKGAIESENDNKKNIKTPSSWHLIEGVMGLYASTVIMELNIGNSIVKGRYFYAKHQKYIDLNGTIDKSGEINLTETYYTNHHAEVHNLIIRCRCLNLYKNIESYCLMQRPL